MTSENSPVLPPRQARRQLAAMGVCYALGTFNDNFFKQAALLLAVTAGMRQFQGTATLLFALPFVLCSAWAGWMADRFPKKNLIVLAKIMELLAMLAGAWGLVTLQWDWLLAMVFCMGASSTLFSPALNSSIPELFAPEQVPRINALFKLATTATILLGIALAGFALDQHWLDTPWPFGQVLVAAVALLAAGMGLAATIFLVRRPGACSPNPFPWTGPLGSVRELGRVRQDVPLLLALLGEAFFYFLSSLLILVINDLGGAQLGLSYSATGLLSVALLAGICAGSFLAARTLPEERHRRPFLAMLGVGLVLPLACAVPLLNTWLQLPFLLVVYALAGLLGGLWLIPLTSFLQLRPGATDKGRVLGLSNFLSFSGIVLAGQVYLLLAPLRPSTAHVLLGAAAAGCALACLTAGLRQQGSARAKDGPQADTAARGHRASPGWRAFLALVRGLLCLRYDICVHGLEAIRQGGPDGPGAQDRRPVLFLPNHPALIDPVLLYVVLAPDFDLRPLVDEGQMRQPCNRLPLRLAGAISLPDLHRQGRSVAAGVRLALQLVAEALHRGDNVLFYPSGKLTCDGLENLGSNGGLSRLLAEAPEARTVLVRTRGLWGSSFSRSAGPVPAFGTVLARSVPWLLANLVFFMPRRRVDIELEECVLERPTADAGTDRALRRRLNARLEAWYNEGLATQPGPTDVPRHFLQLWLDRRNRRR